MEAFERKLAACNNLKRQPQSPRLQNQDWEVDWVIRAQKLGGGAEATGVDYRKGHCLVELIAWGQGWR